jgi:putative membrane protein
MQTLAQRFFTTEEQQRITQTVHQVEQRTAGEIVPMVVSASHAYPEAKITGAAVVSLPLALIAAFATGSLFWWPGQVLWLFLAYFSFFFLATYLLMRLPVLLRLFIRPERAAEEVERAALAHFYAEGLQATRDGTGVLLYISVLERRVWILGDRGINERLSPQVWQAFVDRLIQGIREKRQCEVLCAVIEEIGTVLHTHFPPKADDRNELSDLLIAGQGGDLRKRQLLVR